ncbi:helix-turn-helix domain-containing protein [Streptomyces sp. NBC_00035]|uniref:helix-turn-helix domain-containing protein n=1 Tax=Streptomyces sp. NBC_00035 TaxID=2903614 RepID=UPI0032430250
MTDYDDINREGAPPSASAGSAAAGVSREPSGTDDVFDYLDSEALASWNLKRIRTVLGVSQQDISDRLKESRWGIRLAQTQIAKIERGERPWRVNEMFAIAEVLGISWDELFRGDDVADDAQLTLLAARLKYQQIEEAADEVRTAGREAAAEARNAGMEMCRTAARLGIDDPAVRHFLEMQYHYASRPEHDGPADPRTQAERVKAAKEYAETEWQRLLEEERPAKRRVVRRPRKKPGD